MHGSIPSAYAADVDTSRYQHIRYTDENGLPQNSIKAIAADEVGNLWLCTEDGLVRFNGERFEQFSRHNIQVNSSRFGDFLYDGPVKKLYAVNSFQEIVRLEGGKVLNDSVFYPARLRALSLHRNETAQHDPLPAWHRGAGLYTDTVVFFTSVAAHYDLTRNYIAKYKGTQLVWKQQVNVALPADHFFTLGDDLFQLREEGYIEGFTQDSIRKFSISGLTGALKSNFRIFRSTDGRNLILYNDRQFFEITKSGNTFSCRLVLNDFDADQHVINCAFLSPVTQQLFLGSATEGLYRFITSPFINSRAETAHGFNIFYSLLEFQPGRLLTGQGMIIDRGQISKDRRPLMPLVSDKYTMLKDADGFIWTKKERWVFRLNHDATQVLDSLLMSSAVNALYRGLDNSIWIGTQLGLYRINVKNGLHTAALIIELPSHVTCLAEATDSTMWIGTLHGLYTLKRNGSSALLSTALPTQYIRSIYTEKSGRTWVTTYGDGFSLFDNGQAWRMPLDTKGYLRSSHCIIEDPGGNFWIPTNKGLFQISKNDLVNYSRDRLLHPYYQYYSTEQGLNTNEFNGGCQPCGSMLSGGRITLPSIDGVVSFMPDSIAGTYPSYPFTVDEILIDNRPVSLASVLNVPRGMSQLTVRISTANWSHASNLRIFFALVKKGEQPVWYPVPDNRTINLTTLPTGDFTLRIRKQNGFGKSNFLEWSMPLHVPAPWFLQPVAFVLLVIIAAVLTWGIIRLRLRIVRRKNILLQEQIKENTAELQAALEELTLSEQTLRQQTKLQQQLLAAFSHDIKAPMKHLMFTFERISQNIQNLDPESYGKFTESIYHHTRRLYHLMNNILQYIRSQMNGGQRQIVTVKLARLLEEKLTIFQDLANERETTLRSNVSAALDVQTDELLFSIILHNLVDNAVKVTVGGVVTITAQRSATGCELIIHDTGIGMSEELITWVNEHADADPRPPEQVTGLGLMIVKDLAALLHISVKVESRPGNTLFRLFIPGSPA
ncbi:ATP-binding protein [Terrimonas sp. NA20]|uniref:histidine kinase n=1 Tax=Terrimonas ginsenosidimutans TaxID=2908004 RepID=A0ABS9KMK7_9BACT|nr:two-component regulator propeller domain-containing protein [Terrimonas ginsenosidimutans]MCG2613541.1 ATP-binding protein [Terrimonas ginsenosidimutans]